MRSGSSLLAAALLPLLALPACKPSDEGTRKPPPATERPRRAAIAFVRCVEQTGSQCVEGSEQLGAWDAFSVMGWLAAGSPVGILRNIRRELEHHAQGKAVLRRFVASTESMREPLRGAECDAERVIELGPLVDQLAPATKARLENIGLLSADLEAIVDGLQTESSQLQGGYLVEMKCQSAPYSFYVATAVDGERHLAVGMLSGLPEFLGGSAPSREVVERSLQAKTLESGMGAIVEGTAHPYLNFPVEAL